MREVAPLVEMIVCMSELHHVERGRTMILISTPQSVGNDIQFGMAEAFSILPRKVDPRVSSTTT